MKQSYDIVFSRLMLSDLKDDIKRNHPSFKFKDFWVWNAGRDNWEFHKQGPDKFYWHVRASNAYEARFKGLLAYIKHHNIEVTCKWDDAS